MTLDDFISPFGNAEWYVIHTYPGYERKVQQNLLKRIKQANQGNANAQTKS